MVLNGKLLSSWHSFSFFFFPKNLGAQICKKNGLLIFYLKEKEALLDFLKFCKHCSFFRFSSFLDLTVQDNLQRPFKVFSLFYIFRSLFLNTLFIIQLSLAEKVAISSISSLFSSGIWAEREAFDLFGIFFQEHSDLRRLLTDYGFKGHPLRKDFPVVGYKELQFDLKNKGLQFLSLEFSQLKKYSF